MIILPNGRTQALEQLLQISGLIDALPDGAEKKAESLMLVTSEHWGHIIREITEKAGGVANVPLAFLTDMRSKGFFRIGSLTVRNAGTDDQAEVDTRNRKYADQCHFDYLRERLKSGYACGPSYGTA